VSALDVLLADMPNAREAGEAAQLLAALAVTRGPALVSLRLRAGGGVVRLAVRAVGPTRPFAESEPGAYARDVAALGELADQWGQSCWPTGATAWWAQLGDGPRIGGAPC
jgi:hypothetical protein